MTKFQFPNKFKISNSKLFVIWCLVLGFCLLFGAWCLVLPAYGQATLPLTVAPARQELWVDPGEKTAITIKFFNRSDTPVSGLLEAVDFVVEDKEGSPVFLETGVPTITGITQISPRFSAASWVALPYDRITIASKDKVEIQAKINVPADAQAGGRYFAVYFEPSGAPTAAEEQKEMAIAARIAGLVYLRVSGPVVEDAYVVKLTAPRFSEYGPISVTSEILNRGNYHIRPKGTLTLTNFMGKTVDEQPLKEQNIFPDASRIYENKLGQKWMFGKYKAELAASYGETGKALTATIFFWVFPWKVAMAVILAVVIVILLITTFYRRFKRRQEELEARLAEEEKEIEELKEKLEKKGK